MHHFARDSKTILLTALILLLPGLTFAQDGEEPDLMEMWDLSMDEVMDIKVEVASNKARTIRESPGIISLVTAEEIAHTGARDLIDVLRLVPGFDFGQDIVGLVSTGVRGIWALEGKVLIQVDGQEYNDFFYGGFPMGNHIPVDQIKRVEIIRGPGSVIYGGHAGLAVINIITKGPEIDGLHATYLHGQMDDLNARNHMSATYGKTINDVGVSISTSMKSGDGTSTREYFDLFGGGYSLRDHSPYSQFDVNLGLNYKNLDFRFIADRLTYDNKSAFGDVYGYTFNQSFNSYYTSLTYEHKVSENLTLKPRLKYKHQEPYRIEVTESDVEVSFIPNGSFLHMEGRRIKAGLSALYDVNDDLNVTVGAEYTADHGEMLSFFDEKPDGYYRGEDEVDYTTTTAYMQAEYMSELVNLTVGGRFDDHSEVGNKFVPRIAVTRVFDKLHVKALYSQAFRLPDIENINNAVQTDANGDVLLDDDGVPVPGEVKIEEIDVAEFEIGYQLTDIMSLTANFFDGRIDNPVAYRYVADSDTYSNFGKIGTQGIEAEYKVRDEWGYLTLGYSYYKQTADEDEATIYQAPGFNDYTIGFPAHKISLYGSYRVNDRLRVTPSLYYSGKRYGYQVADDDYLPVLEEFEGTALLNIYLNYQVTDHLKLGLGVYDILDDEYDFVQPYNGYHGPFPEPTQEVLFEVSYQFSDK